MKQYDVIVIGGGFAGLFAAITAAERGKQVLVVAKGVGSIAIGGGTVDVLGYDGNGRPVRSPWDSLVALPADHPYTLLGWQTVADATQAFLSLCSREGYPYMGRLQENQWIPTALGTKKPSCFKPLTMDTASLKDAKEVVVVGFDGLKDYCTQVIIQGLTAVSGGRTSYSSVSINTGLEGGRDISALDVARWMDTEKGRQACIAQLTQLVAPQSVLLLPPVLGTRPTYEVFNSMEQATRCKIIETVGLPPAVIGFRLRRMLVNSLKKLNVRMIEQATVVRAAVSNGRCTEITTENIDRERSYRAHSFILATGGLFGGGLQAGPGFVTESVFNLPVQVPQQLNEWGNENLFFTTGQPFARFGVSVNGKLQPVDAAGKVLLENVYVAGQNLGGYDYCVEKSGNGVALATAYRAGLEA